MTAPPQPFTRRDVILAFTLAGVVLFVAIPILLMGVDWLREDWLQLRRVDTCDPFACRLPDWTPRPVMGLLYDAQYRLFRHHPGAIAAILNLLLAGTAATTFFIFRHYLNRVASFCIVLLWAVAPTHATLQRWAATSHATTSLFVASVAVLCLLRRHRTLALMLSLLSIAIYEASMPLLLAAFIANYFVLDRTHRRRVIIEAGVIVAVTLVIVVLEISTRDERLFSLGLLLRSTLAFGIPSINASLVLMAIGTLGTYVAARRIVTRNPTRGSILVLVGWSVVILGAAPFITSGFDAMYLGLGDRASMISAFGGSMIWVGIGTLLAESRQWSAKRTMRVLAVSTGASVVPLVVFTLMLHASYSRLDRAADNEMVRVTEIAIQQPHTTIVLPKYVDKHGDSFIVPLEGELSWRGLASSPRVSTRFDPTLPTKRLDP